MNPELSRAKNTLNYFRNPGTRLPRGTASVLLACVLVAQLSGCAGPSVQVKDTPPTPPMTAPISVDETAMLPLLGYAQLLYRMSAQELSRERTLLTTIPKTPITQVRLAMLLAQPRGQVDLTRAQALLDDILKSSDPVAVSLHPLVQTLATQYGERLKLENQKDKLSQQLKETQARNAELQDKLDALANIERSLPVRPKAGEMIPGSPR